MKTVSEWSLEFDLLYNNIASDKAPGLTEYEKSVFLSRAEAAVVIALYRGTYGDAFEATEEVTAYLDSLVKQADCQVAEDARRLSPKSVVFRNPDDLLFRTLESANIQTADCGAQDVAVVPVTQDEYWRTVRNPFKRQNNNRVLRLSYSTVNTSGQYLRDIFSELLSDSPVNSYVVRYIAYPEPIILEDLNDGLSIDGYTAQATCKLPEALHQSILTEAVQMAKAVWTA